jgi:hypothetical protein
VRKHSHGSGLDERQATQPVEKLAAVADHERLGKPVLSSDAQMRAYFKCPPMQRCRDIVEQPAYERLDHVRMANRKAFGLQSVQVGEQ